MNLLQRINLTRNYPESLYHPLPLYQKSECQSKCHDSFISGFWRDETKVRKVALSPTTFAFREDAVVCCSVTPVSFLPFKERGKKKRRNKRLLEAFVRRGGENYRESGETAKKCTEMGKLVSSCAAKLLTGKHEDFCFCPLIIKPDVGF